MTKSNICCYLVVGIGLSCGCKSPPVIPAGTYRDRNSNSYIQVWDETLKLHVEPPVSTNLYDAQFQYGLLSDGRVIPATLDYWYGKEPFEFYWVNSNIVITNPSARTGISLKKTE